MQIAILPFTCMEISSKVNYALVLLIIDDTTTTDITGSDSIGRRQHGTTGTAAKTSSRSKLEPTA